jgi:hypothetical protein
VPGELDAFGRSTDPQGCRHEAWEIVLDRIELDVIRGQRALEAGLGPDHLDEWHVPDDYGPIPAALRERAQEILARQQQLLGQIAERLGVTAQHQAIVANVGRVSTRTSDQAIYVDVNA